MEIRAAAREELPRISELLRIANNTPYDLPRVAEEKCFGPGLEGPPHSLLAVENGAIVGVAVSCGHSLRIIAVQPDRRRQGIGSRLLAAAEAALAAPSITVGGESGNYFVPGVVETDENTCNFLESRGYKRFDEAVDLSVDLTSELIREPEPGTVRRAQHHERERVLDFIERAFARPWGFEAQRAFEHPEPTLFIAEEKNQIVGFSAHDANNRGLGFFGPEGVVTGLRGKGLGRELLLASLTDLRRMGFTETIIAWAAAHDFYRRVCGARVAYRFHRMRKRR